MNLEHEFQGVSLFIGCPSYDGRVHHPFALGLCQLSARCTQLGIPLQIFFATGAALVAKARNVIADRFLQSGATHLMLIDADIGFAAGDVLALLERQIGDAGDNPYDVLAAPYPRKELAWDAIGQAVRQGLIDGDDAALRGFAARVDLAPLQDGGFDIARPLEVHQAATGFMMIRRPTLEAFEARYPERRYASENAGMERDCSPMIAQFFETAIDGQADTLEADLRDFLDSNPGADHTAIRDFLSARQAGPREYVSEDYMFCRLVRRIGLRVWTCPWIELSHLGTIAFAGRLADLARLTSR